jgi:hypothetical protein
MGGASITSKFTQPLFKTVQHIIHFYDEPALRALKLSLAGIGIGAGYTPPGLHSKRAERYIRTLKERVRSVEASLSYEVPEPLRVNLYLSVIADMNRPTPCPVSSVRTKHSRVRNQSPQIIVLVRQAFFISIEQGHIPNGASTNATIEHTCLLALLSIAVESSYLTIDTQ